jgi:hypothetical protein
VGIETLAIASLAGSILSAGVGAIGASQQASAQAASANYQAQVARNNQQIAEQNARYATSAGQSQAQANDLRTRAIIGQQEAAQGASGIDLTTGSLADVRESTRQMGRLGTLNIIQNAALTSYGYRTQATSFGAEAGLNTAEAGYAQQAGFLGAGRSLLGGASSFSDKWLSYQLKGPFGQSTGSDIGDFGA